MFGRRNATKDIFRAVVMAGAMLGATACGGKDNKTTTPPAPGPGANNPCGGKTEPAPAPDPAKTEPAKTDPAKTEPAKNPCEGAKNPCEGAKNPCGARNPCEGGPRGRGFVLA